MTSVFTDALLRRTFACYVFVRGVHEVRQMCTVLHLVRAQSCHGGNLLCTDLNTVIVYLRCAADIRSCMPYGNFGHFHLVRTWRWGADAGKTAEVVPLHPFST